MSEDRPKWRRRGVSRCAKAVLAALATASSIAHADISWNNPNGGSWQDGTNWLGGNPPGSFDNANFNLNSAAAYTVSFSSGISIQQLKVPNDTVDFDLSGQTLSLVDVLTLNGNSSVLMTNGTFAGSNAAFVGRGTSNSTLTLSGATFNSGNLFVGFEPGGANGTLIANSGAVINTPITEIGDLNTATGQAYISGTSTVWNNLANQFTVGDSGAGSLTLSGGAHLNTLFGAIGVGTTGTGNVLVTGTASLWSNPNREINVGLNGGAGSLSVTLGGQVTATNLIVGNSGSGTLLVQSGGVITDSADGYIGSSVGGTGTATIDGTGSSWNLGSFTFHVGNGGTGNMTVSSGASSTAGVINIGVGGSSVGSVNVTGPGSTMNAATFLTVGADSGNGQLTIQNGGRVTTGQMQVGSGNPNSKGSVTISGSGSSLTKTASGDTNIGSGQGNAGTLILSNQGTASFANGNFYVGRGADGTLSITGGAVLTITNGSSGVGPKDISPSATGSVFLSDPGSSWITSGNLTIGDSATGSVTVSVSASLSASGLVVGNANGGVGSLTLLSGGRASGTSLSVGVGTGSTGSFLASGSGSTFNSSGATNVGVSGGSGSLRIDTSAIVSASSSAVGTDAGSTGTVNVTGAGSEFNLSGQLAVGGSGNGTVNVDGYVNLTAGQSNPSPGSAGMLTASSATVAESGSLFNVNGSLAVGNGGSGSLTVNAAGPLTTVSAWIGNGTAGTGNATITDINSSWSNTQDIQVGRNGGIGNLTVTFGGQLLAGSLSVGVGTGSSGNFEAYGLNSSFNSSGVINIGVQGGIGIATVSSGAIVTATDSSLGGDLASSGTLTVVGADFNLTGQLTVGGSGNGTFVVTSGAEASANNLLVGAGGTGTATVIFGGSLNTAGATIGSNGGNGTMTVPTGNTQFNVSGSLTVGSTAGNGTLALTMGSQVTAGSLLVGSTGAGSVSILSQGTLTTGSAIIGGSTTGNGFILVGSSGSGNVWNNQSGSLQVGVGGPGVLQIRAGGQLNSALIVDGNGTGAFGKISVSGTNAVLSDPTDGIVIAHDGGGGSMTVNSRAQVTIASLTVGEGFGSSGTFLVATTANFSTSGVLTIADQGATGLGQIQTGALVAASSAQIGVGTGSNGTLNVTSSSTQLNLTGSLTVGNGGAGSVAITSGGQVSASTFSIGDTNRGYLSINGSSSVMNVTGTSFSIIGNAGAGTLLIQDGGRLNASTQFLIGEDTTGNGYVSVTGSSALLNVSGGLLAGGQGTATLVVGDGGEADIGGGLNVGNHVPSTLSVNVGGTVRSSGPFDENTDAGLTFIYDGGYVAVQGAGAQLISDGYLVTAWNGNATMSIASGGLVSSNPYPFSGIDPNVSGFIGRFAGSNGIVTIDGVGSRWIQTGTLAVGFGGNGNLALTNGGTVSSVGGVIARNIGSTGSVLVSGNGSAWVMTNSLYVGGSGTMAGGSGTLIVDSGGKVVAPTSTTVWDHGFVNYKGGTFSTGTLALNGGGAMILTPGQDKTLFATSITTDIAHGSKLDLADNKAIVAYSGSSPINSIRQQIQNAYNFGAWNGAGITSSSAAADHTKALGYGESTLLGIATFGGVSLTGSNVLIKYTCLGDANLDGKVDISDLILLANHWNQSGQFWTSGDFNYDGVVNVADLVLLAKDWQDGVGHPLAGPDLAPLLASLGLPDVAVPEPTGWVIVSAALAGMIPRRIRRMARA